MNEHLCWICQERQADSNEHKFKASDLRLFFGKGDWSKEGGPVHGIGDAEPVKVAGPGSSRMTFECVLCEACNNRVTQPFDRAYEVFVGWSRCNKARLLQERLIDFEDVFGDRWERSQINLFRYFAKHLGCRIAGCAGHWVPGDLRDVIHECPFTTALRVTFEVNEDILLGPGLDKGLFLGPLGHYAPDDAGIPTYFTHVTVGWLRIGLWYYAPTPPGATEWIANLKTVGLGAHSALTEEQREEVRRRGRGLPHRPALEGEGHERPTA